MQSCGLCGQRRVLRESHIIPAFVYRWFKESSATGHIRTTETPNRRLQDGPKRHLLCHECEERFSARENLFQEKLFKLITQGKSSPYEYDDWLMHFAASPCWRIVVQKLHENDISHLSLEDREHLSKAEARWRQFLLGEVNSPGEHELHFIPLGIIGSAKGMDLPPNFNRYLTRAIHHNLLCNSNQCLVLSKMGPAIVLGFIRRPNPPHWHGTRIEKSGKIGGSMQIPDTFLNFLRDTAASLLKANQSLSARQRDRISESYRRNIERAVTSDTWKSLSADIQMFGEETVFGSEDIPRIDDPPKN